MRPQHSAILFLALLLGGCALLRPAPPPGPTLQELREQHRYVSALKVLDAGAAKNPEHDQQREALLAEARQYQAELLGQASDLLKQQQFAKAQELLQIAQPELPEAAELDKFNEQLIAASDRYAQRYLDELVALRGPLLLKEQAPYQSLQKAAGDPEVQKLLARRQADIEFFAPLLSRAGSRALTQGDYAKAVQYLGIANQLAPSQQTAQLLARAEQSVLNSRQKQQSARNSEREQRYRDLLASFQQALQQRNFLAARDQLEQAKVLNIHNDEIESSQRELDAAVAAHVAQLTDNGNRHYANGHIEAALNEWRQAEALNSTAELREKIEKAQRFIGRLEQLRQAPNK